ncbi:protein CD300H-like isoform X1 [Zalophus californianus]|uniref:Protein CD300H-like isoform X1 n=1 Tax=Zalophus californianus TaxID=9704 RepID=A0A6J2FJX0_ZALCA|nr:protein CD300H-like isoform X1 [Zalophus californianus]
MTPGDRRPWLPVALLLLQVPGCSSLSGPTSMTGTVGGSLSVQCQYEEKFRDIAKYWCKSPCLGDIVKIEKSDKEVRNGRVSIRNHPVNLTFTVTLENLTEGDAGTYRCGIDTSWLPGYLLDVTFHVVVSVTPGSLSLSGPSTVMGTVGGSLRVQCRYEEKYKTFTKYWCRQPCLPLWNQTVATRGSEEEMRSGRVSIVDHPGDLTFTVTLENLTVDDTGKYRCGIATILHEEGLHGFLPDLFFQVQVFVSPRSLLGSVHFLLLILLKVPLFLIMLSAVLWVNRPQWATCGTQSRPDEDKRRPSLSIDILSRDTATQTRGGRTSDPKPSISSHLIAKNW